MSILKKYSNLPYEVKKILTSIFYKVILLSLFLVYLYSIMPSNNATYTDEGSTIYLNDELVSDVGTFNSNNYIYNSDIKTFLNETFSTRNKSFLDGSVEKLYKYYNTKNINGRYSLKYEFKRIAYLRDWSIERSIIFTNINSSITIKDIKNSGNKLTIKVLEDCDFTYIYSDNPQKNKFSAELLHTLTISTIDDRLIIDKDYYLDFFGGELNNYSFSLKEKNIPLSKSINKKFTINDTFKTNTMLNYTKFAFTDHQAIVCGHDYKGYPLVNCSTLKTTNIPFDFGWNKENIKP